MAGSNIEIFLDLITKNFSTNLEGAKKALKAFGKETELIGGGEFLKTAGKSIAGVFSVGAVVEGLREALRTGVELGASMSDLSERTGMSVASVYDLSEAFKDGGVDAEKLGSSVARMQRYLAKSANGKSPLLNALGLNGKDLAGARPEDAFRKIGAAINALPNSTARAAAAMAIYGKNGAELLSVFADPEFRDGGNASRIGQLLQQNAKMFKEYSNLQRKAFDTTKNGFSVGFASDMVPKLLPIANLLSKSGNFSAALGAGVSGFVTGGFTGPGGSLEALYKFYTNKGKPGETSAGGGFDMTALGIGGMPVMADSLARVGGGGNFTGDGALLGEQQKQSNYLRDIRDILSGKTPSAAANGAVFY